MCQRVEIKSSYQTEYGPLTNTKCETQMLVKYLLDPEVAELVLDAHHVAPHTHSSKQAHVGDEPTAKGAHRAPEAHGVALRFALYDMQQPDQSPTLCFQTNSKITPVSQLQTAAPNIIELPTNLSIEGKPDHTFFLKGWATTGYNSKLW